MSKNPDDILVAQAFSKGLGIEGNQVDAALDATPPKHTEGEWMVAGPTKAGSYVIGTRERQIAIVTALDGISPQQARANALAMSRAVIRLSILEHILTELEGDDEGTRHPDLLLMIRDEVNR